MSERRLCIKCGEQPRKGGSWYCAACLDRIAPTEPLSPPSTNEEGETG